jgi:hypothetical protein
LHASLFFQIIIIKSGVDFLGGNVKIFILVSTVITLPCLADITTVTFDHQKPSDKDAIAFVDAKKGEYIEVRIVNSCAAFTESFEGVKKITSSTSGGRHGVRGATCEDVLKQDYCIEENKVFSIPNSGEYDGYKITYQSGNTVSNGKMFVITAVQATTACANGAPPATTGLDNKPVENMSYTIIVNQSPWETKFSGGLAVSWLTDPQYYVDADKIIRKDNSAQDDQDLVFAAFAHVSNRNWKNSSVFVPSLSAGLGTQSGDSLDYFLGVSWELGEAFITTGYHWGQVDRLRSGVAVGTKVDGTTIPNDILSDANMMEKRDGAAFLALTYTFGGEAQNSFTKGIAPAPVSP